MRIYIQKYYKPTDKSESENLFGNDLTFIDQIVFDRHLIEALPMFTEEFTRQDNILILKAGDFDLVFSMGMSEKSWGGKTIYQFFNNVEASAHGREKYFVLVEVSPVRKYSGIINIGSIEADEYDCRVEFSVITIDKEAVEWMKQKNIPDMGFGGGSPSWEHDYMPNIHFQNIGDKLSYRSYLDINSRAGYDVQVRAEMQAQLFFDGLNQGYSIWSGLESFLRGWFIRFKVEFKVFNASNKPTFWISLFWRSQGINNIGLLSKFKENRKALHVSDARWVFINYGQLQENIPNVDYFIGLLFSKTDTFIGDILETPPPMPRIAYLPRQKKFQALLANGTVEEIPEENVLRIDLPHHAKSWANWIGPGSIQYQVYIAYCRIVHSNYSQLLQNVIRHEASFLLEGIKDRRLLTVKCPDTLPLMAGSLATIQGKQYGCERITSYDTYNKEMETEWILQ